MSTNEATAKILQFTKPENVTTKEFLNTIFLNNTDRAWVCSVKSETASGIKHNAGWKGGRVSEILMDPTDGHYYSLGKIRPGATRKSLATWDGGTMMTIDDVGEKSCPPDEIIGCLGEPTAKIQTSTKSQQWIYVFDREVTNITTIARLQRAATLKFYPSGTDPGHEPAVQYLRIPSGVNDKDKHTGNGTKPAPAVTLAAWNPERRFDPLLDLAAALGDAWNQTDGMTVSTTAGAAALTPGEIAEFIKTDPVLAGLDELGRVRGPQGAGWVEVQCPWEGGGGVPGRGPHSNLDDRAGYNPSERTFKCHHSCKEGRADVEAWLPGALGADVAAKAKAKGRDVDAATEKQLGDDEWARIRLKLAVDAFSAAPLTDMANDNASDRETTALLAKVDAAETAAPKWRKLTFLPLGTNAPTGPIDDIPEICALLARGECSIALGQPGIGKSLFVLKLMLALTSARPGIIGEAEFDTTQLGDVLYVSNEDDTRVVQQRVAAEKQASRLSPSDFIYQPHVLVERNFKAVRGSEGGAHVALTEDMAALAERIAEIRAAGGDVCAVILDTLTTIFAGVPENDNNAMGNAVALLSKWALDHNVAIVIPHHQGKAAGRSTAGDSLSGRGASATAGAARRMFTVTEPDPRDAAKLLPAMRGNVFSVTWAKGNYGPKWAPRYFERRSFPVEVRKPNGVVYKRAVVAAVLFKPNFGWDAKSDNAKVEVLTAIANAEKATEDAPGGNPIRVARRGDAKGAADRLAEELDAKAAGIAETLDLLLGEGLIEQAPGPRQRNGSAPKVWRPTEKGARWLETGPGGFTDLDAEPEGETAPVSEPVSEPAKVQDMAEMVAEAGGTGAGILPGLGEIDFGTADD